MPSDLSKMYLSNIGPLIVMTDKYLAIMLINAKSFSCMSQCFVLYLSSLMKYEGKYKVNFHFKFLGR